MQKKKKLEVKSVEIDLNNIGFAAAKEIHCKWQFNINSAIELIRSQNDSGFFHIYSDKYNVKINIPKIEYVKQYDLSLQFDVISVNYLLPVNIDSTPFRIKIPKLFLDLYSIYLCCKYDYYSSLKANKANESGQSFSTEEDELFPNLFLFMSYKDLKNKLYKKKFEIKLDLKKLNNPNSLAVNENLIGENLILAYDRS